MAKHGSGKLVDEGVSLFAFNYTDRSINDIFVNGMWLGGMDPHSNSGSAAGLMAPKNRNKAHTIEVHWTVGSTYNLDTKQFERRPLEKKKATVQLAFPYPEHPNELVLHFFPDGHVEAELIQGRINALKARRIQPPKGYER